MSNLNISGPKKKEILYSNALNEHTGAKDRQAYPSSFKIHGILIINVALMEVKLTLAQKLGSGAIVYSSSKIPK